MTHLEVGDYVRIWRRSEIAPPWFEDMSSNGRFIINYSIGSAVSSEILGETFVVALPIDPAGYISMRQIDKLGPEELLHHSLIAEVLTKHPKEKGCNCGKDITGTIGRHSYWCNLA